MPPPSLVRVLSALLLLIAPSTAALETDAVKYTASLSGSPECLDKVNAAREAAGFSSFTQATNGSNLQAPQGDISDGEWKKMCDYLIPAQEQTYSTASFEDGTYAFKSLTSEKPECESIVNYWKTAFKNFTGLPPSQNQAADLYSNQHNISFVALYNPSANATADCRVATCTKSASPGPTFFSDSASDAAEKGYALICKTMPTAFKSKDTAPFTQDQWNMITASLTGSTIAAAPRFFLLVISALGMMIL
ncbi:SAG family member [Eimeria necatrix]|uniref:SAG family member n=1 Tax=Eimeria necatrix TaxID=51315 RepID=U6MRR3_9EIME|nr:SAG family member [Eimeria necatrix]CDJ64350.1 SAG family member [Eimeria necatrix]